MIAILAALFAFQDPAVDDEQARERIARFQKAKGGAKGEQALVEALEELGAARHPRILKELREYLKGQPDAVKIAAARRIGDYGGDKSAADALALVLPVEAARASRDEAGIDGGHEVAAAVVQALAGIGRPEAAAKLHSLFDSPNHTLARAAVDAAGELRNLDSVEPLIRLLIEVEQGKQMAEAPRTNTVKPPPGSTPGMSRLPGRSNSDPPPADDKVSREAVARHAALAHGAQKALQRIARDETDRTGKEWSAWWAKNRAALRKAER
jgi:HEAT repeat protein